MSDKPIHFDVQLSELYTYESTQTGPVVRGKPTTLPKTVQSSRNQQLDIITTSAARAIELALERHPSGTVHVVQRRGSANLIIDPQMWL